MPVTKSPQVLVIGAGAAGIAATSRLLENGIYNIIVLEAESRIGGRIHSVEINGNVVDLGAQWCHGERDNIVYDLVKDFDLLKCSPGEYSEFIFYDAAGEKISTKLTDRLIEIVNDISYDPEASEHFGESFGKYFISKYNEKVREEFGSSEKHLKIALQICDWSNKYECCLDACPTWFDLSPLKIVTYKECEGEQYLNWKNKGYKIILDVLMKKFPNLKNQLAVEDKIFYNKEVCNIEWDKNVINPGGVTVECVDGSSYNVDHVIITLPLGVLKDKHNSLFTPQLPLYKQNAIDSLGFGCVNKCFLEFSTPWWPKMFTGISLLWAEKHRENIVKEFPRGLLKDGSSWLEAILGFYTVTAHPNLLLGWFVGPQVKTIERLSDEVVLEGCMYLLRKCLGNTYDIPQPLNFICSAWNSNPHFCGTYSYRSIESDKMDSSAQDLAEPVVVDSKQVLLFSGEATHPCFYSTVHGAIESGFREADRLISIYQSPKLLTCKIAIVGAGMAGLAAAMMFLENSCEDIVILEASNEAGGRIKTMELDDGIIDLGAQWIHSTENCLYTLAKMHNLISSLESEECLGIYVRDDGFRFDDWLVKQVDFKIGNILEECETFVDCVDYPYSVGDFLDEKFHLDYAKDPDDIQEMKLELFDWHAKFQHIDNACRNLKDLSAKEWGKYLCAGSDGQAHILLKHGYKSFVDTLLHKIPEDILKLNTPVSKINWKHNKIKIDCSDKLSVYCDHVIVTPSLGVLKHYSLFEPSLPKRLTDTIQSMGYYAIGKIYLIFDYQWWDVDGFQLIWRRNTVLNNDESWIQHVTGFELVLTQPKCLLGWIGGDGVAKMEKLSEEDVGVQCVDLLKRFLKTNDIPYPTKVITTKWNSSPWIRGAYSHITPECDRLGVGPSTLSEPVYDNGVARILLAGEACHPHFFSTTHGAFESGQSQAKRLLNFL